MGQPVFVVAEFNSSGSVFQKKSNQLVVQENPKGNIKAWTGHQRKSVSRVSLFVRGPIRSSKSSADKTDSRVSILAEETPCSSTEMVSWRTPAFAPRSD
jgi:hypothetical protein